MSETKLSEKIDEMVKTAIETREVIRCDLKQKAARSGRASGQTLKGL